MSADIQTSTPQGSPLLAYGEARGPRLHGTFLAALVAVFLLTMLLVIGAVTFFVSAKLPKHILVLAAFHGGAQLSDPLPRVWQHTAETSKLPFIAGIAQTETGWQPFTVTLRGFAAAGSWSHGTNLFSIHADTVLDLDADQRVYELMVPILLLKNHATYISMDAGALDPTLSGTLSGTIDGNTWKTDAKIAQHAKTPLTQGDVAIDFTALPESWPLLQGALKDTDIVLDQMPETLSWTASSNTMPSLVLTYGVAAPSTSTILGLAAATGQFDTFPNQLPDGSLSQDLRLPLHILSASSSEVGSMTTGTGIRIEPYLAAIETSTTTEKIPQLCPGQIIGYISQKTVQAVARSINLHLENASAIELTQDGELLSICW